MTGKVIPPEDAGLCNNADGCDDCVHYEEEDEVSNGSQLRWVVASAFVFVIFLIMASFVFSADIERSRAVNAIIGESEGEPYKGKLAVACAIRNRGTLKGVYGEKAPRVTKKLYSAKIKADSERAWDESESASACQFIDGADHWEGTAFKKPTWAYNMTETFRTKGQVFYVKR
jgi:hypothetical protein